MNTGRIIFLCLFATLLAGCTAQPRDVHCISPGHARQIKATMETYLKEWNWWGRILEDNPVVCDFDYDRTTHVFVEEGMPPFKEVSKEKREQIVRDSEDELGLMFRGVAWSEGKLVERAARFESKESTEHRVWVKEVNYDFAFVRIVTVTPTQDPQFPWRTEVELDVTSELRETESQIVAIVPPTPAGFRPATETEHTLWEKTRFYLALWGGCTRTHSFHHNLPMAMRDFDLPLPARYHYDFDYSDSPPEVVAVIEEHLKRFRKLRPTVTTERRKVTLWYSRRVGRWFAHHRADRVEGSMKMKLRAHQPRPRITR